MHEAGSKVMVPELSLLEQVLVRSVQIEGEVSTHDLSIEQLPNNDLVVPRNGHQPLDVRIH